MTTAVQFARLGPDFAVAPQVRPGQLEAIAAAGFRAIVNNRPDGEEPGQPAAAAIEAEAHRLGLAYCFIPVGGGLPLAPAAKALRDFLDKEEGPVFAFCRSGNRSTQLWNLAQRLDR